MKTQNSKLKTQNSKLRQNHARETQNSAKGTRAKLNTQYFLLSLALFLLALLPRAYALQRFVTADEAKWIYRSAQFLAAFLRGDLAATSVNLTPAVTTTWLGSLGLWLYYLLNHSAIGRPLIDWLMSLPEFRVELEVLAAARWPMVLFTSLSVVLLYWLVRRLFHPHVALLAAVLVALDPHTVALSRVLGHDAPAALFMTLSVLLLLVALRPRESRPEEAVAGSPAIPAVGRLPLILSGAAAGLAFLSKAPALFLIPFAGLLFASRVWGRSAALYPWFKRLALWLAVAYLTFVFVWPAAWVDPLGRPRAVVANAFLSATDQEEADAEGYWLAPDLGPAYYLVNGGFKLSPLVMIGAALAVAAVVQNRRRRQVSESVRRGISESASQRIGESASQKDKPGNEPQAKTAEIAMGRNSEDVPTFQRSNVPTFQRANVPPHPSLLWLLLFALLFTLFMTAGDKRSARYILPAFPALAVAAAFGWLYLYRAAGLGKKGQPDERSEISPSGGPGGAASTPHSAALPSLPGPGLTPYIFIGLLTLSALVILLPYGPYYFSYFNPLLGGPFTAPHLVKIGWGEGLDQVGRYLQREQPDSRVGAAYASTVAPFFEGDLSSVTGDNLDLIVLYSKQVQSGQPSPTFIRYFDYYGPIFSVELNGLHYADVYPGPALQPALTLTPGLDHAILPQPIGFRPLTPYGRIGQELGVDVLWLANDPLPADPSVVTLQPASAFDFLSEDNDDHGTIQVSRNIPVLAQGEGYITRLAPGLIVSRHTLPLPADLERGVYALLVDRRPLGEIEVRRFQAPAEMEAMKETVFGEQIGLIGYEFEPTADYISLTAAWQARKSRLPDYTIFVQLIDADTGERVAGVDEQPLDGAWPTSGWAKGEVVVDEYVVAVPPGLPPGNYHLIAGLYRPNTGQRLVLADGRDHWLLPWTYVWKGENVGQ